MVCFPVTLDNLLYIAEEHLPCDSNIAGGKHDRGFAPAAVLQNVYCNKELSGPRLVPAINHGILDEGDRNAPVRTVSIARFSFLV